jgi:hypothetical protein
VYVAAGPEVRIYDATGNFLTKFEDASKPYGLSVDSTGKLYVLDDFDQAKRKLTYYAPSSFPPTSGTSYTRQQPPLLELSDMIGVAVNPANDHVFVAFRRNTGSPAVELDSAAHGSTILNSECGSGLGINSADSVAVNGATGEVYVSYPGLIAALNPSCTKILKTINGWGSPIGAFSATTAIAVDQTSGDILAFNNSRGAVEEFEPSGAFVGAFAFAEPRTFTRALSRPYGIAVVSSGQFAGETYVAFDDTKANTPDVWGFGPVSYGEPPIVITGVATALGDGNATLNGSVDPRGFNLTDCHFAYTTESDYEANHFGGSEAKEAPCMPDVEEIGKGSSPVAVHADVSGLDSEGRYRFLLVAANEYGSTGEEGEPGVFGVPAVSVEPALPVLYTEATLRATVDPSGLATKYRFEYGEASGGYEENTRFVEIPPSAGTVTVKAPVTGLTEGKSYHFRVVAENEMGAVTSVTSETFETQVRQVSSSCANASYRTGFSAALPDCRAYELVTPAETRGALIFFAQPDSAELGFNMWATPPFGASAGETLSFFGSPTLPGFEGTGHIDGYRAARSEGEGPHPTKGWHSELVSPTYAQAGGGATPQRGVAPDQRYSFWSLGSLGTSEPLDGTLPKGIYLHTPNGVASSICNPNPQPHLELLGCGSSGPDFNAKSLYVSAGGTHVVFSSSADLEAVAPPAPTVAIYDRSAGEIGAEVVSTPPAGAAPAVTEEFESNDAVYVGSSEDATTIFFEVDKTLYAHRGGETLQVAAGQVTFAGTSQDGQLVAYMAGSGAAAAELFSCDLAAGPCTGAGGHAPTPVGPAGSKAFFVNVSADGTHAFFASKEAFADGEENENEEVAQPGQYNLYAWDAQTSTTRFIALIDSQDIVSFDNNPFMSLLRWTQAVGPGAGHGLADSPTRSTPDGKVFVFQSHASLAGYNNEGHSEIYRYDPAAAKGEQLICVSCDPSMAPATADATLQTTPGASSVAVPPVTAETLIANLREDGSRVFFQSMDQLLPEDSNNAQDVYEWTADEVGESCHRPSGCLALISSGQGERDNYIYGASANGSDVFFHTLDQLLGADVPGSPSIYDAREEGGIPEPVGEPICHGDACHGAGSTPPALPGSASTGSGSGNVQAGGPRPCRRGSHRVKGRCRPRHHRPHRHRAQHRGKAQR